jgi:2-polyprenyl-6-methoxyphenol hydroxylase-like FAD-dependent oxidoreductase
MRVLIIGAGIAGLATAKTLSRLKADVTLIERRPVIETLGSGVTLIGPALRALDALGVLDECRKSGYEIRTFETRDHDGHVVNSYPLPSPTGSDLPGMLGMLRPTLHGVLHDAARDAGVHVRTGITADVIENRSDGVGVTFSTGEKAEYDFIVGADGVWSSVRELTHGTVEPQFRGQGCIRVVLPRPESVTGEVQYQPYGGISIGFTPTSATTMYLFCSFAVAEDGWPEPDELLQMARDMTAPFGGVMSEIREHITDPKLVNLAKFSTVLAPQPWVRNRAIVIGDAAHCPTPQLAAGAAMCLEDAVALEDALRTEPDIDRALADFCDRRYERCRYVVETATLLSYWQTYPGDPEARHEELTEEAFRLLAEPV